MSAHKWFEVAFNYAGWIECECGFRPGSPVEFDQHTAEHSIDLGNQDET